MSKLHCLMSVGVVLFGTILTYTQPRACAEGLDTGSGLKIAVLKGEDGVNIIKKKTAVAPVVEVRDRNDLPVAGALVVFLLPRSGPGAKFADGARELRVTTGVDGRAEATALRPVGKGSFRIQVRASFHGETATANIAQSNFATVAAAQTAGKVPGNSAGAASGASSSSSTVAGAGSAVAAPTGGLSGLGVAGIVAGGAGAVGGGLLASGFFGKSSSSSSGTSCTSLVNQAISDLNLEASVCSSPSTSFNQCKSAAQTVLDDVGRVCSCSGSNSIPSELQSFVQQLEQLARQLGLSLPSACGF